MSDITITEMSNKKWRIRMAGAHYASLSQLQHMTRKLVMDLIALGNTVGELIYYDALGKDTVFDVIHDLVANRLTLKLKE